ncbi:hypothetical protein [Fervidobacterium sp.]
MLTVISKFSKMFFPFVKYLFHNPFFDNVLKGKKISKPKKPKTLTLAIIHYDGKNLEDVLKEFFLEITSANVIVGKNFSKEDVSGLKSVLKKDIVLLDNNTLIYHHGKHAQFISSFDVHKLRAFEKQGVSFLVVPEKRTGWMISQMFSFYCIVPGEPFQETIITAPIPLTRNSDGYYFSKVTYRNQVTIIDLNVEILSDFKSH